MRTRVCQSKDKVREVPSNVNPEETSQYTDEIFALQHFLFHFPACGGSIRGDRQHGGDEHQHCGGYPEVVGPACEKYKGYYMKSSSTDFSDPKGFHPPQNMHLYHKVIS